MRMRIVVLEGEVLKGEVVDPAHLRIDPHSRKGAWFPGQLQFCLLDVIGVEVQVPEGVDEVTRFVVEHLCDHHRKQGVACDIERDSKKEIRAALVELA